MNCHYFRNGMLYTFAFDLENPKFIRVFTDNKTWFIPCFSAAGIAIKINKKSLSADNGTAGVYDFISWSIRNDLMTIYIDRIIDRFCN